MDTNKIEHKKISMYRDYDKKIGEDLINESERIGNPKAFIKAKYGLDNKVMSAWLGTSYDGFYKQEHFIKCNEIFKDKRKDFLDRIAINGKINRDLWASLQWSQLNEKVNPPKEVTCEADIKASMKVEDLNNIIEKLEDKKANGF
ncbi:MAG: hypothetical protein J6Q61_02865 [Bacteroidales bacterium]|nr:hypothetical protein [Bacteroidales bacterium]MBO5853658.1 hypothetical protein [Bacteroidales bacterium]